MRKKVVPKLRQEVILKVAIITSNDIKIYYTGKFQDFTARCIENRVNSRLEIVNIRRGKWLNGLTS